MVTTRSGIDTNIYGSHSVRSASTSKAKLKMVPIADIINKAGWTRQSTFAKFYDKDLEGLNASHPLDLITSMLIGVEFIMHSLYTAKIYWKYWLVLPIFAFKY